MAEKFYKSKNITMCPDGKYRWVYELDMYKSSAIIKELWRVLLISGAIVVAFLFIINIMDNDFMDALRFVAQSAGILFCIFLVLSIVGYLIFAYIIGGKYCVVFEMDEEGINHKQHQKHVKKSELIGAITALAGIAGGNLSTVGTGILAAARTSLYTGFDEVKELEILPKERLIRLNETLSRNQVYAADEDFAFVASYIQARCRNAKVKGECYANVIQPQICSNCGAKLKPGSRFCTNCGAKV